MKIGVLRWDAGVAVGSEYSGGFLTVQPDLYGEEKSGGEGGIVQHPFGFLGRPADPDGEGSCQALHAYEGDQLHVLPTQDARALAKLPELKKGGSVQYGIDGGFGSFDPETHTWTLYIPTDFDAAGTPTKAHLLQIGKDTNGKRCVTLLHADGPAISILEGDKKSITLKNAASNAYVEVNDDGIVLNGNVSLVGGLVAGNAATAKPLTTATELGVYLTALETWLRAVPILAPFLATFPPSAPAIVGFTATQAKGQ